MDESTFMLPVASKISSTKSSSRRNNNDSKLIRKNKGIKLFKGNEANQEIKLTCGRYYLCFVLVF